MTQFEKFLKKHPEIDREELRKLCVTFVVDHYHNRDSQQYIVAWIRRNKPGLQNRKLMDFIKEVHAIQQERVAEFDKGVERGDFRLPGYIQYLEETLK